jgi:hypothetical protein
MILSAVGWMSTEKTVFRLSAPETGVDGVEFRYIWTLQETL